MKANCGEDRIANTDTDKLLKTITGNGGTVVKIYTNGTRYYQVITREFSAPVLGFIRDWEAKQIIG